MICVVFVIVSNPLLRQLSLLRSDCNPGRCVHTWPPLRPWVTTGQRTSPGGETGLNTGDQSVKSSHCIVRCGKILHLSPLPGVLCGPTEMSSHHLTEIPSSPARTAKTRLDLVLAAFTPRCPIVQVIGPVGGGWQDQHMSVTLACPGQLCENIPHGHPQSVVSLNPQKYSKTTQLI